MPSKHSSTSHENRNAVTVLVCLCILAASVLFIFRGAELSGMSSGAAAKAAAGKWDFFSHHLLYQPVLRVVSVGLAGLGCDVICAGQVHSILWALVAIACSYFIVWHLTRSVTASVATAVMVICANGIWIYSTQLEPYVAVVAINALIIAILIGRGDGPLSLPTLGVVTGLFSLSLFFHQANIFFLVPLVVFLSMSQGAAGFWAVFKIGVFSGIIALAVNMVVFWGTHPGGDIRDFYLWLNYYGIISNDVHGSWDELLSLDLGRMKSVTRAVVATILAVPSGALQMPVRSLMSVVLFAVVVWNAVQVARHGSHARTRVLLLTWAGTFILFFWWWQPHVWKFYLFAVVPLVILSTLVLVDLKSAAGVSPARSVVTALGIGAVGIIAAVNFNNSIWPLATSGSGIVELSGKLAEATPSNCMIYTERRFTGYLELYHNRASRPFELMFLKYHYTKVKPIVADAIPVSIDLKEDACAVIPLDWLSTENYGRKVRNRSMREVEGAEQSAAEMPDWSEFIKWMLEVRPASSTPSITHDAFEIFRIDTGEAFVRIARDRTVDSASLDDLLAAIEDAVHSNESGAFTGDKYESMSQFKLRMFSYN